MPSLALIVSYDGSRFVGAQTQPGQRTVQGELEGALARLFGQPTQVVLAGRTDRGVHAAGQVVSCEDRRPDWTAERLQRALDAILPPDLAVVRATRKPDAFHARYDAVWREYRYRIWTGSRAPLARSQAWERTGAVDLGAMRTGAALFLGSHDFATFAGGGEGTPWAERRTRPRGAERTIIRCDARLIEPWWGPKPDERQCVEIQVAADGFLPRMARTMTSALVEIGQGRRSPAWIGELLAATDRRAGPATAPAHGLILWRVGYDDETPDDWMTATDRAG
ncbi:MAG TPA: tRNA pseudouridine(38-40) synthase TruA [Thermomicrobiales bacterium]|nr:tRNA pseudouridine(38-40) synthase TruA [Thermomicrobiales bacterium]